jgi:DNA-binding GntR family transcriptional regulator
VTSFENVKRQTLADSVYDELRDAILRGAIPGQAELNQVTLARQFNVSRVPVREALRRLQSEHLVTAAPYQRYIVSAVKPHTLLELIDIREELEVYAVRKLVADVPPELTAVMRERNAELRRQDDGELWLAGDIELHMLFDSAATEAANLVRELRDRVHRYLRNVASTRSRRLQACTEHDHIIDATEIGDADAAADMMRRHIHHTRLVIATLLDSAVDEGALEPAAGAPPAVTSQAH